MTTGSKRIRRMEIYYARSPGSIALDSIAAMLACWSVNSALTFVQLAQLCFASSEISRMAAEVPDL